MAYMFSLIGFDFFNDGLKILHKFVRLSTLFFSVKILYCFRQVTTTRILRLSFPIIGFLEIVFYFFFTVLYLFWVFPVTINWAVTHTIGILWMRIRQFFKINNIRRITMFFAQFALFCLSKNIFLIPLLSLLEGFSHAIPTKSLFFIDLPHFLSNRHNRRSPLWQHMYMFCLLFRFSSSSFVRSPPFHSRPIWTHYTGL